MATDGASIPGSDNCRQTSFSPGVLVHAHHHAFQPFESQFEARAERCTLGIQSAKLELMIRKSFEGTQLISLQACMDHTHLSQPSLGSFCSSERLSCRLKRGV